MNKVYESWFRFQNSIAHACRRFSPVAGAILPMICLEIHQVCRAAWYQMFTYRKTPSAYGLDEGPIRSPVLLVPGAVGSWNYLGDLAMKIRKTGRSVFTIDLGAGDISEKKIEAVKEKLAALSLTGPVDIVAHSMGCDIALRATARAPGKAGKIICIANPTDEKDLQLVEKINAVYNITAQYDGLLGHKVSALPSSQKVEIPIGHIGIVFHPTTHEAALHFLGSVP